jgi:hypothetical protein
LKQNKPKENKMLKRTASLAITILTFTAAAKAESVTTELLQAEIVILQKQITTLQATCTNLPATQKQVAIIASNPILALGPYVYLDMGTENEVLAPNIVFHGANVHVISGRGGTADNSGLGNLIVGYCEPGLYLGQRHGSHNLIVGQGHMFPSYGGFAAGLNNILLTPNASILGGYGNTVSGNYSVVIGGTYNNAGGNETVVGGGFNLHTTGISSTLLGGYSFSDPGTQYYVGFGPSISH